MGRNLNETFSVLLCHFPVHKASYRKEKQAITKCGSYRHEWEKRKRLINLDWTKLTGQVKKQGKTLSWIITLFSPQWATSSTLPTATSKIRMKTQKSSWTAWSTVWPLCPPGNGHKQSRPCRTLRSVGLGCQLSSVMNTWLTTPAPSPGCIFHSIQHRVS